MNIWWKVFKMRWNSFKFRLIRKLSGHKKIYKMINLIKADVYILERNYKEIENAILEAHNRVNSISSERIEKQIFKKIDGKLLNVRKSFNEKVNDIRQKNDGNDFSDLLDNKIKEIRNDVKAVLVGHNKEINKMCISYVEESRHLVKYFKDNKNKIESIEDIVSEAHSKFHKEMENNIGAIAGIKNIAKMTGEKYDLYVHKLDKIVSNCVIEHHIIGKLSRMEDRICQLEIEAGK